VSGRSPLIAVCGTSNDEPIAVPEAEEVGALLVAAGAIVVCGGGRGVMAGVARGVRSRGGICIGVLPGDDANAANDDITIALPTGLGEQRNAVIAQSCRAMIAVGGGYGTLSEIGFALRLGKPIVGLHTWSITRAGEREPDAALHCVETPAEAVDWVLSQL
jgi:uncharacterized protein (TIGR00725 family)